MDPTVLAALEALQAKVEALAAGRVTAEDIDSAKKDVAALLEKFTANEAMVEKQAVQIAELRNLLKKDYGKSGAQDWAQELGKFLCGVFHHKMTGKVPDELKVSGYDYDAPITKAYTIGTGATMGYLIPTLLMPGIIALRQVQGKIMSRVTKMVLPPLASMTINSDDVLPTVAYVAEGTALGEVTTAAVAKDTVSPKMVGGFITAQNELLNYPGIGFAEQMAVRFMNAIIQHEEKGMVGGTVAGSYPSEGIISASAPSAINAQTALATATVQNILAFIAECVADQNYAEVIEANQLIISTARYWYLAGQAVGTNVGAALAWADPAKGIPPNLFGYTIIPHSGALVGATHSILLGDLSTVQFAHSGEMAVDFNPYPSGWAANQSLMKVMTHSDWSIGATKAWHKATITA